MKQDLRLRVSVAAWAPRLLRALSCVRFQHPERRTVPSSPQNGQEATVAGIPGAFLRAQRHGLKHSVHAAFSPLLVCK